jgi:predicted DNA-binding transcriptional regulator AlpA
MGFISQACGRPFLLAFLTGWVPGKGFKVAQAMHDQHELERREMPRKEMYDLREFSAITGMSMTAIRRGLRADDLPIKPIRVGGMWRFRRREVDRLVGIEN